MRRELGKLRRAGFTLTEMLVASFISVAVVAGTYSVSVHSFRLLRAASNRNAALDSARSAMEYLRTLPFNDSDLAEGTYASPLADLEFNYNVALVSSNGLLKRVVVQTPWYNTVTERQSFVELAGVVGSPLHEE